MNRFTFRPDVQRFPIRFAVAAASPDFTRGPHGAGRPGSNVLFLTVDLARSACASTTEPDHVRRSALFGDGAAGVVLRRSSSFGETSVPGPQAPRTRIRALGDRVQSNTEHIMGFDIKDDGFGILLSPRLPGVDG